MAGRPLRSVASAVLVFVALVFHIVPSGRAEPTSPTAEDRLTQASAALDRWHLGSAEELLSQRVPKEQSLLRDLLLARLDLMRARHHQVVRRLKGQVQGRGPLEFERRIVLGRALQAVGKRQEAYQVLDTR